MGNARAILWRAEVVVAAQASPVWMASAESRVCCNVLARNAVQTAAMEFAEAAGPTSNATMVATV
jgi:hypothetical protein